MKLFSKILLSGILLFMHTLLAASNEVDLVAPFNGANRESATILFEWNRVMSDDNFTIQISQDSTFAVVEHQNTITANSYTYTLSAQNTYYYWRVKSNNRPYSMKYAVIFFTPKMVPNLLLWVRSDTAVTTTSGRRVTQWNDLSGNNNHIVQSDTTMSPLFSLNQVGNGQKPSLLFNGTTHFMNYTNRIFSRTCFAVVKHNTGTTTGGAGAYPTLFGDIAGDLYGGDNSPKLFWTGLVGAVMSGQGFDNGASIAPSGMVKPTVYKLINLIQSADVPSNRINKTIFNNGYWQGGYAEIFFYSDAITENNRKKVENYFFSRYVPPVNLGTDKIANSFCDAYTLNAGAGYVSYLWNTGENTPSINVTARGEYSVTVIDIHGKSSTDKINIFPPLEKLGGKTYTFCQGDSVKVDLKLPEGFTASWSDGRTGAVQTFTKTGKYIVTVSDLSNCTFKDSIIVNVDTFALSPELGATVNVCTGTPLVISASSQMDSILWANGATNDSIFVNTPGAFSVFARTVNGCVYNKNFNIAITGSAPTVDFSFGGFCQNTPTLFTDNSLAPSGNTITGWNWEFGDGATSTSESPSHTYTAIGAKNVRLTVTTNVGCSNTISKPITVNDQPIANFYYPNICSDNQVRFFDSTTVINGTLSQWNWTFDAVGTASERNPFFAFPSKGSYLVTLTARASTGCIGTISKNVNVLAAPVSNFTFSSACVGQVISFNNTSTIDPSTNIVNRTWYFGDGTSSNLTNPTKGYAIAGTYTVTLINVSNQGCIDSIQKPVIVYNFPKANFELTSPPCANSPLTFADSSKFSDLPINQWQWKINNTISGTTPNLNVSSIPAGNYNIELKVSNTNGCSNTKIKTYAITAPPVVDFNYDPEYAEPPVLVNFTNLSPTNLTFQWNFGDGPQGAFTYNAAHNYNSQGAYDVTLKGTDIRGCSGIATKTFVANNPTVDIAVINVSANINNSYYKPVAKIENKSNVNIKRMTILAKFENGTVVAEDWSGVLPPNSTIDYVFVSSLYSNNTSPVLCVEVISVNNSTTIETDYSNNKLCIALDLKDFYISSVAPNPTSNTMSMGIIVPNSGTINIEVYDAIGNIVYLEENRVVAKGYNNFVLDMSKLQSAAYLIYVNFNGEYRAYKVMKL